MRLRTTAILATAALGLTVAGVASAAELPIAPIGTGEKTCVLKPGADCRGVVHRWTVEHHGNLRGAKFTKADLRGVDFRGADLRKADFRGAKLHHADFRGARLKGARFDVPPGAAKRANGVAVPPGSPPCPPCQGANLAGAMLQGADLEWANLTFANLTSAYLVSANLTRANLDSADLTLAILNGITWLKTVCPDGSVTSTGCLA